MHTEIFEELLAKANTVSVHTKNLQLLANEIDKTQRNLKKALDTIDHEILIKNGISSTPGNRIRSIKIKENSTVL